MQTKIIDGVEYVLKTDIENAMKERISKLTSRATDAEQQIEALQKQVEAATELQTQNQQLQSELKAAKSQYERHNALAQNGFIDADIRDAVEWAYERATRGQDTPQSLVDWLQDIKANPDAAPTILRPHLNKTTAAPKVDAAPQMEATTPAPKVDAAPQMEAPPTPPKTNTGAQPHPTQKGDILSRAVSDIDFYRANRDAIRKAWHNR